MKIIFGLLLICSFSLFSCEEATKILILRPKIENKTVKQIKHKISEFKKKPARDEVRSYLKGTDHKYQENVNLIKKIKTALDPQSDVYLEINLFTNDEDKMAPLIAQFMWFDINTKNLVLEENLNLE